MAYSPSNKKATSQEEPGRWDLSLSDLVDLVRDHIKQILIASAVSAALVGAGSVLLLHDTYIVTTTLSITSPTGSRAQTNRLIQDVLVLFEDEAVVEQVKEAAGLPDTDEYAIAYEQGVDSKILDLKVQGPSKDGALEFSETLIDVVAEKLEGAATRKSFATLNSPNESVKKVVPPRVLYALEAAIGGFLLSTFAFAVWSKIDVRLRVNDIEGQLSLPLLGQIPFEASGDGLRVSYEATAANIRFANPEGSGGAVALVPVFAEDGVESIARGVADALATEDKTSLYVNADMRTGRDDGKSGLSQLLAGDATLDEAVSEGKGSAADALGAGYHVPNPSDLFASDSFASFVEDVRARYDTVAIMTPDAGVFVDAAVIGRCADSVILLVEDRKVTSVQAKRVLDQFKRANVHVAGVIATKVRQQRSDTYYDYEKSKTKEVSHE